MLNCNTWNNLTECKQMCSGSFKNVANGLCIYKYLSLSLSLSLSLYLSLSL